MYVAVKGIYKDGKVSLLEKLEGVNEAEVLVIVLKKKRKKKTLTNEIVKALEEVNLMRKGELPEKDWEEIVNEI